MDKKVLKQKVFLLVGSCGYVVSFTTFHTSFRDAVREKKAVEKYRHIEGIRIVELCEKEVYNG